MTFSCRIKVQSKAISPHDPAQWRWTMSQIVHVACGQHTCDFYGDAPLCLLTNISVDSLDLLKPQCTVTYPDSINVLFDTDLSIFILICSSLVQLLKQIWDGQSDQQKKRDLIWNMSNEQPSRGFCFRFLPDLIFWPIVMTSIAVLLLPQSYSW